MGETDWEHSRAGISGGGTLEENLDKETAEQFQDQVLNKRAAKLHLRLRERMEDHSAVPFSTIARKEQSRKYASQKFYSLLVLQKCMAVNLVQSDLSNGEIDVMKGARFDPETDGD